MPDPTRVFVVLPTYDGSRYNAIIFSQLAAVDGFDFAAYESPGSLLAFGVNKGWAEALNARQTGIQYVLLVHDDIVPLQADWFQVLWGEMQKHQAKVLSVVSPLKSGHGLTSTAMESSNHWKPRRLSMTEVMCQPETWTDPALLVNTGLLLIDFRDPWVERICFTINDRIVCRDGRWEANVESEDWHFSRQCRELGVQVYATRKVGISHVGLHPFGNTSAWGSEATDPVHKE